MSIDLRQFHESFYSESFAGLDATEANLLRLESGERSPELLNAIFRAIHSIKGAAGSLGFPEIGRFTHEFEHVLDDLRKGDFEPDPDAVDIMLACVDHVRFSLRAAQQEKPHDPNRDAALLVRLTALREDTKENGEKRLNGGNGAGAARAQLYRIRF